MLSIRNLSLIIAVFLSSPNLLSQQKTCISVSQETQSLSLGAKSIFRCDIYYNIEKNEIVTHHTYPAEFIKISNKLGETKIYFPAKNTVSVQQDNSLSSTNELLYYFLNNRVTDLGLQKEGFRMTGTTREDDLVVTLWEAPVPNKALRDVKVVFKDMLPIYAEYRGMDNTIRKKIYYSGYRDFTYFSLPMRITEISFESRKDSTIRRSVFSNIRFYDSADSGYFNYKIPENARLVK